MCTTSCPKRKSTYMEPPHFRTCFPVGYSCIVIVHVRSSVHGCMTRPMHVNNLRYSLYVPIPEVFNKALEMCHFIKWWACGHLELQPCQRGYNCGHANRPPVIWPIYGKCERCRQKAPRLERKIEREGGRRKCGGMSMI